MVKGASRCTTTKAEENGILNAFGKEGSAEDKAVATHRKSKPSTSDVNVVREYLDHHPMHKHLTRKLTCHR